SVRVKCVNNERQLGIGLSMYCDDARSYFPMYSNWGDWGGAGPAPPGTPPGTGLYATGNPVQQYSWDTPTANRPINTYVNNVRTYCCPADTGDTFDTTAAGLPPSAWTGSSCFLDWGNSYLMPWREQGLSDSAATDFGWLGIECIGGV